MSLEFNLSEFWNFVTSEENRETIGWLATGVVAFFAFVLSAWEATRSKKSSTKKPEDSQGPRTTVSAGAGGSAFATGSGTAIGGAGGRVVFNQALHEKNQEHARPFDLDLHGAKGGDAIADSVSGADYCKGGDAGETGVSARPLLGGPSQFPIGILHKLRKRGDHDQLRSVVDRYGIALPGRGGISHEDVVYNGEDQVPLSVALMLMNIWEPDSIADIDSRNPMTAQDWWNTAREVHPELMHRVASHLKAAEEAANAGRLPPDPYE